MSYVLQYTVVTRRGEVHAIEAISHADAANRFVAEPRYGMTERWPGQHTPEDGERITVVGLTQEAYRTYNWALRARQNWEMLPPIGKGKQKSRNNAPEPKVPAPPKQISIEFRYEQIVTYKPVCLDEQHEDAA